MAIDNIQYNTNVDQSQLSIYTGICSI